MMRWELSARGIGGAFLLAVFDLADHALQLPRRLPARGAAGNRGVAARRQAAGVISTSALELGIDVGGLDACVLVGWPGSVMAGDLAALGPCRAELNGQARESLTALVALPDALDQWLVRHPEELLARPCEPLVVARATRWWRASTCPVRRRRWRSSAAPTATYLARHAAAVHRSSRRARAAAVRRRRASLCACHAAAPPRLVAWRRRDLRHRASAAAGASSAPSTACGFTSSATRGRSTFMPVVSTWCAARPGASRLPRVEPSAVDWYTTALSRRTPGSWR